MPTLEELIASQPNPFDADVSGNFYQQPVGPNDPVETIHQEGLGKLRDYLAEVRQKNRPYTSFLMGAAGNGKTFMLGRFQRDCGNLARFAYIGPWSDGSRIWQHILRCTVRSWQYPSPGEKQSQLAAWYDALKAGLIGTEPRIDFFEQCSLRFPQIEEPEIFLKAVARLENPEMRRLALNWLRGDNLSEESLTQLDLEFSIDNEDLAKAVLTNLLRINPDNKPAVLCFDQLDSLPKSLDGKSDFSPLFNFNTQLHNDYIDAGCLVLISVITETYNHAIKPKMDVANRDRIRGFVGLKPIPVDQITTLWQHRLAALHAQAVPQPSNPLMPLHEIDLEKKFPAGRHAVRGALRMGYHFYQAHKELLLRQKPTPTDEPAHPPPPPANNFLAIWDEHYAAIDQSIHQLTDEADPDRIWYLEQALTALKFSAVHRTCLDPEVTRLRSRREASQVKNTSLCFQQHGKTIGLAWTENDNMTDYCWFLRVVEQLLQQGQCDPFILIRAGRIGNPRTQGRQLYDKLTGNGTITHIEPELADLRIIKTLHILINKVAEQGITLQQYPIDQAMLQQLARESGVLERSRLLTQLGVTTKDARPGAPAAQPEPEPGPSSTASDPVVADILQRVTDHHIIGRIALEQHIQTLHTSLTGAEFDRHVEQLIKAGRLRLVDPNAALAAQLICRIPDTSN